MAFDCPHYQKLIPNHLRDLAKMPRDALKFLESGAFVCSVTGKHMRSVALDEAHEMFVNEDLRTIIHPSKEYLDHMLFYYPVRSVVLNAVIKMQFYLMQMWQNLAKLVSLITPHCQL